MCKTKTHTHSEHLCPEKKKGQSSALTTCSKFYMQAMFEVISIVVFLFISTKAADRLPRDPKENSSEEDKSCQHQDAKISLRWKTFSVS